MFRRRRIADLENRIDELQGAVAGAMWLSAKVFECAELSGKPVGKELFLFGLSNWDLASPIQAFQEMHSEEERDAIPYYRGFRDFVLNSIETFERTA